MYFTQSSISALVEKKYRELQNGIHSITQDVCSISVSKEGSHIAIINQLASPAHPGKIFIYRKEKHMWILEYVVDALMLLKEEDEHTDFINNEQYIFNLDAWFNYNQQPGFIIKIGNLTNNRFGLTYEFELKDEEYKIVKVIKNSRIQVHDKCYHINGV